MADKQAQLVSGAILSYAEGDGTDVEPVVWTALLGMITSIPEMFGVPDTVDTTTIENTNETSIPALQGGDSLDFGTLLNTGIYAAHATMLASQIDPAKGASWFKLTFSAPLSREFVFRATVPNNVVVAGGGAADLNAGTLALFPSTDIIDRATP